MESCRTRFSVSAFFHCPQCFVVALPTMQCDYVSLLLRMQNGTTFWKVAEQFFFFFLKLFKCIYLFIWLCQVLVAARKIFSCSMWDPGINPDQRPPALGVWNLSHGLLRKFLHSFLNKIDINLPDKPAKHAQ